MPSAIATSRRTGSVTPRTSRYWSAKSRAPATSTARPTPRAARRAAERASRREPASTTVAGPDPAAPTSGRETTTMGSPASSVRTGATVEPCARNCGHERRRQRAVAADHLGAVFVEQLDAGLLQVGDTAQQLGRVGQAGAGEHVRRVGQLVGDALLQHVREHGRRDGPGGGHGQQQRQEGREHEAHAQAVEDSHARRLPERGAGRQTAAAAARAALSLLVFGSAVRGRGGHQVHALHAVGRFAD